MTRAPSDRERLAGLLGATRVVPLGVDAAGPIELLGLAARAGSLRRAAEVSPAPSPMIHDAFFEGLTNPEAWIEAA